MAENKESGTEKKKIAPKPSPQKRRRSIANWIKHALLRGSERTLFIIEQEKIDKMSPDEAKFYLELVEKQLHDSVDTGQIITERSTNMLNLTSALLIALIAYSIDRWETNKDWDPLLKMAVWGCVILAVISVLLIAAILPKSYCIAGWTTSKILQSKSFSAGADENQRQKNIALNLLENYEGDIEENNALNKKRWTLFKLSMLMLLIAPICFASYYLLFR
jgi:hypothetical protein